MLAGRAVYLSLACLGLLVMAFALWRPRVVVEYLVEDRVFTNEHAALAYAQSFVEGRRVVERVRLRWG